MLKGNGVSMLIKVSEICHDGCTNRDTSNPGPIVDTKWLVDSTGMELVPVGEAEDEADVDVDVYAETLMD